MAWKLLLATVLALASATVAPQALADSDPGDQARHEIEVPDFGSAVPVPSDSDYQISDTVISCEDVQPGFVTPTELYEEQAEICTRAGFPSGATIPETGGPCWLVVRANDTGPCRPRP